MKAQTALLAALLTGVLLVGCTPAEPSLSGSLLQSVKPPTALPVAATPIDKSPGALSAQDSCAAAAPEWHGTVISASERTLRDIRHDYPDAALSQWGDVSDDHPAALCYIDGGIPKGAAGSASFDRAIVAVVDGDAELLVAGFASNLPAP